MSTVLLVAFIGAMTSGVACIVLGLYAIGKRKMEDEEGAGDA